MSRLNESRVRLPRSPSGNCRWITRVVQLDVDIARSRCSEVRGWGHSLLVEHSGVGWEQRSIDGSDQLEVAGPGEDLAVDDSLPVSVHEDRRSKVLAATRGANRLSDQRKAGWPRSRVRAADVPDRTAGVVVDVETDGLGLSAGRSAGRCWIRNSPPTKKTVIAAAATRIRRDRPAGAGPCPDWR